MLEFMASVPAMAMAGGGASMAGGSGGGAHAKFQVDPDQAEQLAKDLKAAMQDLERIAKQVEPLTNLPSPGKDMYSGLVTAKIREVAGDSPGGYLKTNREAREALAETVKNIQDALKVYRKTEANAHTAMRSKG